MPRADGMVEGDAMAQGGGKIRFSQVFGIFKVRETGNREYWFAQIVVLLSTVIGVYLAAQAGYKTAIEFEVTRGDRDGYYLRRTLLAELKKNVKLVDEWGANIEKKLREKITRHYFEPGDNWSYFLNEKGGWEDLKLTKVSLEGVKLNTFIWDTMKQQFTTFQLPPDTISSIESYYSSIDKHVADVLARESKTGAAATTIVTDTEYMRKHVINSLETDIERLRARLAAKNIELR